MSTIENDGLTPTTALGVALSTEAMPTQTMGEAQTAAPKVLAHLEAMGFTVTRQAAQPSLLDVERLARALDRLPDRHNATMPEFAEALAAEYAALREGRTP